jgi:hypothetical protein
VTPDLAIVYHRLQQLGTQGLRMLPNIGIAVLVLLAFLLAASICRKPVPAQYNAAHALSKQDGQHVRADGREGAALH